MKQFSFEIPFANVTELFVTSIIVLSRVNAMWVEFPRIAAAALNLDEDDCRTKVESAYNEELTHRMTDLIARFGKLEDSSDDPPGR